jgi:hypothetical protein
VAKKEPKQTPYWVEKSASTSHILRGQWNQHTRDGLKTFCGIHFKHEKFFKRNITSYELSSCDKCKAAFENKYGVVKSDPKEEKSDKAKKAS